MVANTSGSGPAVVLLHGQPGSRGDWTQVVKRLEADFLVIAPDRPGYGDTGGRARGFRGNAAAVVALLDRLGVSRATVVGYSWSGGVAVALAEAAPERLTGLVLVSSVGPGDPLSRLDRMLAVPPIGTAVTAAALFVASGVMSLPPVRRALRRCRKAPAAVEPIGAADATVARAAGAIGAADSNEAGPDVLVSSWRSNRVWQSFVTEQRSLVDELPFLAAALTSIRVPTVVLVGGSDRLVPPATGRRLAVAIPGARLVELAGAGHLLALQHPAAVAAAVRQVTNA